MAVFIHRKSTGIVKVNFSHKSWISITVFSATNSIDDSRLQWTTCQIHFIPFHSLKFLTTLNVCKRKCDFPLFILSAPHSTKIPKLLSKFNFQSNSYYFSCGWQKTKQQKNSESTGFQCQANSHASDISSSFLLSHTSHLKFLSSHLTISFHLHIVVFLSCDW